MDRVDSSNLRSNNLSQRASYRQVPTAVTFHESRSLLPTLTDSTPQPPLPHRLKRPLMAPSGSLAKPVHRLDLEEDSMTTIILTRLG